MTGATRDTAPTGTNSGGGAGYRPDIDGLRAVAVLAVVAFHAFPAAAPGGFIGVDVFFVISGYLITGIILRQARFSLLDFYSRRARRIFPALTLMLLGVLSLGYFLLGPTELRALGKHAAAGAGFSANIIYWLEAGYFDTASETKPLLHLWSLGVEEQYYFVWPLLVALLRRWPRWLEPAVGLLILGSFLGSAWATSAAPSAAFYLPVSRFWELGVGGWLAIRDWRSGLPGHPRSGAVPSFLGAALLGTGLWMITEHDAFPGAWAVLPSVGAALLIGAGEGAPLNRAVLSSRPMVALGLVSYPLYLWHWPLLSLGRIVFGTHLGAAARALLVALSLLLAAGTYFALEQPVRRRAGRWTHPGWLAAMLAAGGALGLVLYLLDGLPGRPGAGPPAATRPAARDESCPRSVPSDGEHALNFCRQSRPGQATRLLVGDSHAEHLYAALAERADVTLFLGNSSCPPVLGVHVVAANESCGGKFAAVIDFLDGADARTIEEVVVSMYSGYALDDAYAADHLLNHNGPPVIMLDGQHAPAAKDALLSRGLEAFLGALLKRGLRVTFVEDVPEFPFLPGQCAETPALRGALRRRFVPAESCSLARAAVEARQAAYLSMMGRIAAAHPELRVVRALDAVCGAGVCPAAMGGVLLYADSHHLSVEGARRVVSRLDARD